MPEIGPSRNPHRSYVGEFSGACGDLGTFIPHVIGAITVAGLAPAGVLFGFAAFLIATGLFYGLPMPVQPMKAVSAVILTDGLRPGEIAAAGIMLGVVLVVLGITGWIGRLARAIPQSVSAGLQLGLGLLMGVLGVKLMLEAPWIGFGSLALLAALAWIPRCPAAPIVLGLATIAGFISDTSGVPHQIGSAGRKCTSGGHHPAFRFRNPLTAKASVGTTTHWRSGESPVPSHGSIGMADV